MRPGVLAVTLAWSAAGAGCGTFYQDAARNLTESPIRAADSCCITHRNHRLARAAWARVERDAPPKLYSVHYARGFKEGYADYLDAGGDNQPPAVPPFCYRLSYYQTPAGLAAIEDWYAGFRQGSLAARESGLRATFLVPLSAPPVGAPGLSAQPPPFHPPAPPAAVPPPAPELPPPTPLTVPPAETDAGVQGPLPPWSESAALLPGFPTEPDPREDGSLPWLMPAPEPRPETTPQVLAGPPRGDDPSADSPAG